MSDSSKAVFLSYASQDAEAAKRIAESLRSSGVEVWFDTDGGLEHGDEWDTKIRRQIKECVLFIAVISANTQAREEGYFRIEWELATDRAMGFASGTAFILPVVIDTTREPEALVPDRFRKVQWTRLPGGVVSPEVQARFLKLWSHRTGALAHEASRASASASTTHAAPASHAHAGKSRTKSLARAAAAALVVAAAIGGWLLAGRDTTVAPPSTPDVATAPRSETQKLVAKVRALFENPNYTRDDLALAEDLCKQALQRDASDAEVWAVYAELSGEFIGGGTDLSPERREAARMQAERAVKLAPDSREARFAKASVLRRMGGGAKVEAEKTLREIFAQSPDDRRVIIALAKTVWGNIGAGRNMARAEEALELFDRAAAFPATRAQALRERGWLLWVIGRKSEAETAIDASLALIASKSASTLKVRLSLERGDLETARTSLAVLPDDVMRGDQGAALAATVWLQSRNPSRCLDVLSPITRDYLSSNLFAGPTDLLRGNAYHLDGKMQAARNAWQAALQVVDKRLVNQARDRDDLYNRAYLLALMDEREAAATALRLYEEVEGIAPEEDVDEAIVHVRLDPPDRSIAMLESMLKASPPRLNLGQLRVDPAFDSLRGDPRFEALLKQSEPSVIAPSPLASSPSPASAAPAADAKSIAVLPFANMSDDKDSGYFADGIHEDILTNLSSFRELRVVSRTTVMQYRTTTKTLPQIAQELGVAYILEGSVRRAGNKVRVTGQLIKAGKDEHVWAKFYDRDLTDIFAIQSELAQAIGVALQAAISPQEKTLVERRPTENIEAYELVLKARSLRDQPGIPDLAEQERLLHRALELDPNYVEAYADLVFAYVYHNLFRTSDPVLITKAKSALDAANRLAPDSPVVARARGDFYYYVDRDFARATTCYEQSARLRPSDGDLYARLAAIKRRQGRWIESLATFEKSVEVDPGSSRNLRDLTILLAAGRRLDAARAHMHRLVVRSPEERRWAFEEAYLSYLESGSTREMDRCFREWPAAQDSKPLELACRKIWATRHGDLAEAIRLDRLQLYDDNFQARSRTAQAIDMAVVFAAQGDLAAARARLEDFPATVRASVDKYPHDDLLWSQLGVMEALLGHHGEALRCAREAVRLVPESRDAVDGALRRSTLAFVLAWTGDKDAAIEEYRHLLRAPFASLNHFAGEFPDATVHVMRTDPCYAPLRGDPRFEALLADPKNNEPLF
jgi:TolB-like protein